MEATRPITKILWQLVCYNRDNSDATKRHLFAPSKAGDRGSSDLSCGSTRSNLSIYIDNLGLTNKWNKPKTFFCSLHLGGKVCPHSQNNWQTIFAELPVKFPHIDPTNIILVCTGPPTGHSWRFVSLFWNSYCTSKAGNSLKYDTICKMLIKLFKQLIITINTKQLYAAIIKTNIK